MINILAIDTSTEACSVALMFNQQLSQRFTLSQRDHTKQVLPMIDDLLKQAGCTLSQIDAIAFAKGPGSFTGVRIGIGIAQGIAFGINKPLVGVSTLATLAQGANRMSGAEQVITAIDARMGEVYLGAYQCLGNGELSPMINECVIQPDQVAGYLANLSLSAPAVYYAGTGWQTYPQMLLGIQDGKIALPRAEDMLLIAQKQFEQGHIVSAQNVEATYLRNDVTWKKLPGR
ncbi:tRNA threonylcarbamoyladenosine biosynthesis protein TsaB [Orbus hercynius]|uniref:tRNA threonylcarbamoyladenosine biosynthesis protein TsaB n=2 Tax=Orbus hercynius TaxID=593135 RepID=A0A495RJK1_9GAMM|nr:tRNA (adenosine(37)-N6)-threonylcarbamoyltransferase complex dimerization subunit type 1 TsaB [Orbus hercynius]RKS87697.1 tRNA threonylcarbamoyladenosine biosynthesis protein TsaB [Orbus hercynius]